MTDLKGTYYIEEKEGRFYVYYLRVAPVHTLFDITPTRAAAEKAIVEHKQGKHATQWEPTKITMKK